MATFRWISSDWAKDLEGQCAAWAPSIVSVRMLGCGEGVGFCWLVFRSVGWVQNTGLDESVNLLFVGTFWCALSSLCCAVLCHLRSCRCSAGCFWHLFVSVHTLQRRKPITRPNHHFHITSVWCHGAPSSTWFRSLRFGPGLACMGGGNDA